MIFGLNRGSELGFGGFKDCRIFLFENIFILFFLPRNIINSENRIVSKDSIFRLGTEILRYIYYGSFVGISSGMNSQLKDFMLIRQLKDQRS